RGILGSAGGGFLLTHFGPAGSWIILAISVCIGLLLSGDNILRAIRRITAHLWHRRSEMAARFAELRTKQIEERRARQTALASAVAVANKDDKRRVAPPVSKQFKPTAENPAAAKSKVELTAAKLDRPRTKQELEKVRKIRQEKNASRKATTKKAPTPKIERPNDLPSMDLLAEPEIGYSKAAEDQAAQRKLVLQQTFDDFNIAAHVDGFMTGPVITLFEVSLSPGVKVAIISSLATDIARALAVPNVRIVPPRFGKETVGIEVPNLDKEIVRLKELMLMMAKAEKRMRLPLYLGKDAAGDAIVTDLAKAPHMLIAGTTGSGKSVCINSIIMSLLMTRTTQDVRFILVDPKMVEMAAFEKLPHLLCPTIHDMKKAEDILEWAATKMDERYEVLREAGVKNLGSYNSLGKEELYKRFEADTEEEQDRIPITLPSYVIIIDELADLMMTSSKEVEGHIIRIAQKARAVGIHLVLATQRPSANVVTGLIKSNMPCRISFRVASGQESRIVLDQKGAEVLLGQGDMLVLQPGESTLDRAQGTFVSDSEIHAVVKELETGCQQVFNQELITLQTSEGGSLDGERDELFDDAVRVVLQNKRGSVSLLQRRMSIGYGRASRIIDQMGESGIIGSHKGSQARECLITIDDWESMQNAIDADLSGRSSLNGEPTSA
ncbi:MAG: DNA translocase FtsK, partial [Phycisphaerae bacterium]|nr:DNA translocase FtsK [Phycisphaerae bacterium]